MYSSDFLPQFNSKKEIKQQPDKPRTIKPDPDGIPCELKTLPQWVCWRWVRKEGEWTKVPINASTLKSAKTDDPSTWCKFGQVTNAYGINEHWLDGIGFVFNGTDLTGIDFDECRYTDGSEDREVREWIERMGSYTELSPTGGGYHSLALVSPELLDKFQSKHGRYEAYNKVRFFCVTGRGNGKPINRADEPFEQFAQTCLGQRVEKAFYKPAKAAKTSQVERSTVQEAMAGAEMRFRLLIAQQDAKFAIGYNGGWDEGKHSETVASFLCKVAFYFGDSFDTADQLFRQSSLLRGKWAEGKWERLCESEWDLAVNHSSERYPLPVDWPMRLASMEGLPIKSEVKVEEIAPGLPPAGQATPQWWTATELWNYRSKTRSLIPKVLMSGSHTLLAASEKKGKTHWINNFIADILTDGVAFNHSVDPMPVLYLDYEMGVDMFREAYLPIYPCPNDPRFQSVEKHFRYKDNQRLPNYLTVEWLRQAIQEWATPGIIVVDSVRGAFGSHPDTKKVPSWENDAGTVGKILRPFTDFCHDTQWNIVSIHHNNKNGNYSGSTEFGASVDAKWEFNQDGDGDGRVLKIIGRGVSGRYGFSFQDGRYTLAEQQANTSDAAIQAWIIEQYKEGRLTQQQLLDKRGALPDGKVRDGHKVLIAKGALTRNGSRLQGWELAPNYQVLIHAGSCR